jgi:hypothetical protein
MVMPNLILKSLGVGMRVWGAIAVIVLLHVSAVRADTLNDALAGAYARNPRLNAERARLRATDENVPQALAGYRPQLNAGLSATCFPAVRRCGISCVRARLA